MLKKFLRKSLGLPLLHTFQGTSFTAKLATILFSPDGLKPDTRYPRLYARMLVQAMANQQIIPTQLQRRWPGWVHQQLSPDRPTYSAPHFPLMVSNHEFRNWTALSAAGVDAMPIVDSFGLITPFHFGWSIDLWLIQDHEKSAALSPDNIHQDFDPSTRTLTTHYQYPDVLLTAKTCFLNSGKFDEGLYLSIHVSNLTDQHKETTVCLSIRPYHAEGVSSITSIDYADQTFRVNGRVGLILEKAPDTVVCTDFDHAGIFEAEMSWEKILNTRCSNGMASAYAQYQVQLSPRQQESWLCMVPSTPKKLKPNHSITHYFQHFDQSKESNNASWAEQRSQCAEIQAPYKNLTLAIEQNLAHLQGFLNKTTIVAGGQTNREFWIKDAVSMLKALNRWGKADLVSKLIERFPYFNPWSRLPVLRGEFDRFGQSIHLALDTYHFQSDLLFLDQHFSIVQALAAKIRRLLPKTVFFSSSNPELSNEILETFWGVSGIESAAKIAEKLNQHTDKENFQQSVTAMAPKIDQFIENLLDHCEKAPFLRPLNLSTPMILDLLSLIYPLGLLTVSDDRWIRFIDIIEKNFCYQGIIFSPVGPQGYPLYANIQLAHVYLRQKNPKLFPLFDWILSKKSPTGAWPEAIHPRTQGGSFGDGHSGLISAEFLILVHRLIISETDSTACLFPYFSEQWLPKLGESLVIKQLPTRFGKLSLTLTRWQDRWDLVLNRSFDRPPATLYLSFPLTIKEMSHDGQTLPVHATTTPIPASVSTLSFTTVDTV